MKHIRTATLLLLFTLIGFNSCSQNKRKMDNKTNVSKTEKQWKESLTPEEFDVLRKKGTERAFTGDLLNNHEDGQYTCAGCGNILFSSDSKFDSGSGWPSFDDEINSSSITKIVDNTHGMNRTEIVCSNCGGHLGHLFNDGPTNTGMRYCVNSVSLNFESSDADNSNQEGTLTIGGGCFWCVEAIYEMVKGVTDVKSGYSGGKGSKPTYEEICTGTTGYAEVIQLTFDPNETSIEELLEIFFKTHDPTTLNRQGADVGTQYRSVIFYKNEEQKKIASTIIDALNKEKAYPNPIVTTLEPFEKFYDAESYHQNYYINNKDKGYCKMVIQPKIEKFEKIFKNKLK